MRQGPRQARDADGATLVEFAIILPLLLLLIFGIVEFARVISDYTTVRTAAREGARFATTIGDDATLPNYLDCDGIEAAANSKAVLGEELTITITIQPPDAGGFTCTGGIDPETVPFGSHITVEAKRDFQSVVPLLEVFLDNIEVKSEQTRQIFKGVMDDA